MNKSLQKLRNAPMEALDYWVVRFVRQIWKANSGHDARVNGTRLFKALMNNISTNADSAERSVHHDMVRSFPFLL